MDQSQRPKTWLPGIPTFHARRRGAGFCALQRPARRRVSRCALPTLRQQINTLENETKMTIKEMRAKREAHMNTMRSIVDRATADNRGLTAAEQKDFDGLKVKVEELGGTLDRASQLGEMRSEIERPIVAGPIVQQD